MKSSRSTYTKKMQQQSRSVWQSNVTMHLKTKLSFSTKSTWSVSRTMMSSKDHAKSTMQQWMATIDQTISFKFAPNFNDKNAVWRADSRSFDVIVGKNEGFKPRGKHTNIITHVEGEPGIFVPFGVTQKASEKFIRGVPGWIYTTNFPEVHLDVEETVGDEMESTEMFAPSFATSESEIVGIGTMPASDVRMGRAALKVPGTPIRAFIGELKVNEQWQPRNWTIQIHGIDHLEVEKREMVAREKRKLTDDKRFIRAVEATEIAVGIKKEFSHYIVTPDSPICFIDSVKANASFSASITFAMESYYDHLKKHDVQRSQVFISFAGTTSTTVETLYTAKDVRKIVEESKKANAAKTTSTPVVSSKVVNIEEVTDSEAANIEHVTSAPKVEEPKKHKGLASILDQPEVLPKGIVTRQSLFAKATTTVNVESHAVTAAKDIRHKK